MMDSDPGATAPWWAAGGAFALWAVREIWGVVASRKKDRTETDANIDLLNQMREGLASMGERLKAMEEGHSQLRVRLEEEINLRMRAQEEAHRLRLRVQTLESAMRSVGAVIPPEPAQPG
ncbi:hypothetical protein ACODUN_14410 [Stenotrophomonas riyadhensis]|uniref:hypothetical protein n=1 Tax=Stenotrophomonas maltophilia TaxID=40324 RepID=UPI0013DBE7F8|nr:hypothetical protein [Stenotrophomonas maltophilia]HEL3245900.1 hypothetical protein [Stenotrophomonas maltophilia]HEL4264306.1 hypothetical protein [Stenotrophomonas maltophilia]